MFRPLPFCLGLFLCLLACASTVNAEVTPMMDKTETNQQLAQKLKEKRDLDDLLGPKDIFPFLPDNHRDSGTGKFSRFN